MKLLSPTKTAPTGAPKLLSRARVIESQNVTKFGNGTFLDKEAFINLVPSQ